MLATLPGAWAAQWDPVYVPGDPEPYVEVNRDSIVRNGSLVEFWAYMDLYFDASEEYNVVNCQTHQIKVIKRYAEDGKTIEYPSDTDKWGQWSSLDRYPEGKALLQSICGL
jgi:hypothetical protein